MKTFFFNWQFQVYKGHYMFLYYEIGHFYTLFIRTKSTLNDDGPIKKVKYPDWLIGLELLGVRVGDVSKVFKQMTWLDTILKDVSLKVQSILEWACYLFCFIAGKHLQVEDGHILKEMENAISNDVAAKVSEVIDNKVELFEGTLTLEQFLEEWEEKLRKNPLEQQKRILLSNRLFKSGYTDFSFEVMLGKKIWLLAWS